ncbi:MAG: anhydro-N-acetylmuramic acid kinase [Pseudomonadota bacterium]|nr:anhydro-N-acetylmuramic acid kinase [Pseudomonadota bacterium]MDE3037587.1 anhydro-N-acetylmuramic acid kinase [Pseudomonadota bacterium]
MRKEEDVKWSLGLMSGTSLDGIDAALIKTDGEQVFSFGAWLTLPFTDAERARVREAVHGRGDMLAAEQEITIKHADAVRALLKKADVGRKEVNVIGFHGQTVVHRPLEHLTWQIGNGALLAEKTGIDVVCDFRRRDVAAGGEGAPLVPLYHTALARHMELPVVALNIGGIANVTWIGRSESQSHELMDLDIMAFDTGPGNVMINEWVLKNAGIDCDLDGKRALAGKANQAAVQKLLADPYFTKTPPKSLDRNHFSFDAVQGLSVEDGAATLTEFAAAAVEKGAAYFPLPAKQWFLSGGGRHNPAIIAALKRRFPQVYPVESLGWIGDALEAQAFAFLAVRSLKKLPLSLPTTTGTIRAVTGGALYRA